MTTVRWLASTPSVTCSAVDADPNPLAPALPVMSEKIPIADSTPQLSNKRTETEPKPQEQNEKLSEESSTAKKPRHLSAPRREEDAGGQAVMGEG